MTHNQLKKLAESYGTKRCSHCRKTKPLSEFHKRSDRPGGVKSWCKKCCHELRKQYYLNHREEDNKNAAIKSKLWREKSPEKYRAAMNRYYKKNKSLIVARNKKRKEEHPEEMRRYAREYVRNRSNTDPMFKLTRQARGMVRGAFRRKGKSKHYRSEEIIGCRPDFLNQYLAKTWEERYGVKWVGQPCHIDHVAPLAMAKTEQDIIALCYYTNLQLLTPEDNLRKRATYEQQEISRHS